MCSREVVCFQWSANWIFKYYLERNDRLCGLVVRVPGYRSRFDDKVTWTRLTWNCKRLCFRKMEEWDVEGGGSPMDQRDWIKRNSVTRWPGDNFRDSAGANSGGTGEASFPPGLSSLTTVYVDVERRNIFIVSRTALNMHGRARGVSDHKESG
jgi:hypothetical protein